MNGYIKIFRQLKEWEWYTNSNVKSLFIHCLLSANFKDKKWQGTLIKRGQFISSYNHLALELGLSVQNIRTAFQKLEKTGELTKQSTSLFTIITVVKFDTFQHLEEDTNTESNKPLTSDQQQLKKEKKDKKEKKYISIYKELSHFFNELTGRSNRVANTDSKILRQGNYKLVAARLNDGVTIEEMKQIIIMKLKHAKDKTNLFTMEYVRFSTLFAPINVQKYLDELDNSELKNISSSYKPPYSIPTFEHDRDRFKFFFARYTLYIPYLENRLVNTTYRERALMKKDAESLCYELEQKNPELAKIEYNHEY